MLASTPDMQYFPGLTKVFILSGLSFLIAIAWTPLLLKFLKKYRLGKSIRQGSAPVYAKMHKKKEGTPTMGGILIWATVSFLEVLFFALDKLTHLPLFHYLNFLTRPQTLLPLGALFATALVGAIDDLMNIFKIGPHGGGLRMRHRLVLYTLVAAFGAWWFYSKLAWDIIHVPGIGDFAIGVWYIPIFIFIMVATSFSTNETDGLDGLAGGTLLFAFASFGVIAFAKGKIELAAFCGVIAGALLAFLWFNIYPARFFMGDTGAMSLGTTLGIIAMLTNSALVLPLIGIVLVIESLSVIIQWLAKKFAKRKIFLSSPIHHHFEARGWPEPQVVMRFWIIAVLGCLVGLVIGLIGMGTPPK
ncbi:phospho-N-acetylmuramoyl-pentapeptide-transferase [bacterium (Candidatus Torokbacteria) CG09_land_8_20_14_0_10_42_11]|nr:MAG: phospho-N-acetylmuramoyl-pentapeptide-transferase [bacterium (Candidatus Torokbacteria) CG09_land_8_20_14_0_10_42_11]